MLVNIKENGMTELQSRCQRARQLLENGAYLLDVRSEEEFRLGALYGAINIPLKLLSETHHLLSKDSDILIYCAAGLKSKHAHYLLKKLGFSKIHDMGSYSTIQCC